MCNPLVDLNLFIFFLQQLFEQLAGRSLVPSLAPLAVEAGAVSPAVLADQAQDPSEAPGDSVLRFPALLRVRRLQQDCREPPDERDHQVGSFKFSTHSCLTRS